MTESVKQEIFGLHIMALEMHNPPTMTVEDNAIGQNVKNPQLHTMRLMRTFSSSYGNFINYMVGRLATVLKGSGGLTVEALNGALAFVANVNPKNEAEAMLAVQIFLTNDEATRAMRQMNSSEWADSIHQFGNLSVKLMRTFTMQVEAMAKLQRGGVQTVKHVHVDNRGGQAVIAENVNTGGPKSEKIYEQSYTAGAAGIGPSVLGAYANGNGVPIPSR